MKKNFFHKTIQIFLLVVMSLTSTGFTAVIGYCSMNNSSVCCCDDDTSSLPATSSKTQTFDYINSSCYSKTIAGGINDINATLSSEVLTKTFVLALETVSPEFQQIVIPTETISHFLFSFKDDTPPKVDIYIQVSSFLI